MIINGSTVIMIQKITTAKIIAITAKRASFIGLVNF